MGTWIDDIEMIKNASLNSTKYLKLRIPPNSGELRIGSIAIPVVKEVCSLDAEVAHVRHLNRKVNNIVIKRPLEAIINPTFAESAESEVVKSSRVEPIEETKILQDEASTHNKSVHDVEEAEQPTPRDISGKRRRPPKDTTKVSKVEKKKRI